MLILSRSPSTPLPPSDEAQSVSLPVSRPWTAMAIVRVCPAMMIWGGVALREPLLERREFCRESAGLERREGWHERVGMRGARGARVVVVALVRGGGAVPSSPAEKLGPRRSFTGAEGTAAARELGRGIEMTSSGGGAPPPVGEEEVREEALPKAFSASYFSGSGGNAVTHSTAMVSCTLMRNMISQGGCVRGGETGAHGGR